MRQSTVRFFHLEKEVPSTLKDARSPCYRLRGRGLGPSRPPCKPPAPSRRHHSALASAGPQWPTTSRAAPRFPGAAAPPPGGHAAADVPALAEGPFSSGERGRWASRANTTHRGTWRDWSEGLPETPGRRSSGGGGGRLRPARSRWRTRTRSPGAQRRLRGAGGVGHASRGTRPRAAGPGRPERRESSPKRVTQTRSPRIRRAPGGTPPRKPRARGAGSPAPRRHLASRRTSARSTQETTDLSDFPVIGTVLARCLSQLHCRFLKNFSTRLLCNRIETTWEKQTHTELNFIQNCHFDRLRMVKITKGVEYFEACDTKVKFFPNQSIRYVK